MKKLKVIVERCFKIYECPAVKVCLANALLQEGFNAPIVDYDKCIKCGKCPNFCFKKALVLDESIND